VNESALRAALDDEFRENRRRLWDMAYRLTGTVSDADDVVQETFTRALATPPPDTSAPWLPWLVRVTMNVGRDHLRRRKTRGYAGPWLPAPIESEAVEPSPTSEQRYGLAESATFAFLLALEALTPTARALVVLRDVFDLTVAETAVALQLTEANVRTRHHRARKILDGYDRSRRRSPLPEAQRLFARLLAAMQAQDLDAVRAVLAVDVRSLSDANGQFIAAARPVEGQERVARFLVGMAALGTGVARARPCTMNGAPALLMVFTDARRPGDAPRSLLRVETEGGVITRLHWVMATDKLAHLA